MPGSCEPDAPFVATHTHAVAPAPGETRDRAARAELGVVGMREHAEDGRVPQEVLAH